MPVIFSIIFGIIPMLIYAWIIYWLDRYEKEPLVLIGGVFVWGAVFAAGMSYLINTLFGAGVYLFTGSESVTNITTGSLIAPIVEESLKGIAVLFVFLVFRQEFDSYLDGVVYAAITALGFAATENALYIYEKGYLLNGYSGIAWLVIVRIFLVGWQHPFYTAFTGLGLAVARLNHTTWVKILAPITGWSVAIFNHSFHNTLASLLPGFGGLMVGGVIDWTGWIFMFGFIVWCIYLEKQYITRQLKEEVALGVINSNQYQIACSAWTQTLAKFNALSLGRYTITKQFYHNCAELAHKKHQREDLGEESGNSKIIDRLRSELRQYSPMVK